MNEIKSQRIQDVNESIGLKEPFREIRPKGDITSEECDAFWEDVFRESQDHDDVEERLEVILSDYINDLKDRSEVSETIQDRPFEVSDLHLRTPEENAEMRIEFRDKKAELINQWEKEHGRPWPRYDHDIYSANGKQIRKAGGPYDAHHIQPLGMGGKNEAGNITPLSAEVHYDKQGIHSPNSSCSRMEKTLGGNSND